MCAAGDQGIVPPTAALDLKGNATKLLVHQRGSLVATTRLLEEHARTAEREDARHWFTIATTVCAHAAVEAILNEWAESRMDAATYKAVCHEPVVDRAARLFSIVSGAVPADLAELSYVKNALCHAQPEHSRSGASGNWVTTDGAQRALAVVIALQEQFFPG